MQNTQQAFAPESAHHGINFISKNFYNLNIQEKKLVK